MESKKIEQEVFFKASPVEVYELYMDEKKHAEFSAAPAKISQEVGGEFSVYGDYATGKNIELVPNKKIVQSWRADDWPDGHYSQLEIEFTAENGGTKLKFQQTGIPAELVEDIKKGWQDFYWQPMKEYLEK